MVISAHISGKELNKTRLLASLKTLSLKYPEDHFIIFAEKNVAGLNANCTQALVSPKPKNNLLLYYWYNYKLPVLLKRYTPDVFISDAGMLCLKTDMPQYLYFNHAVTVMNKNSFFGKLFYKCLFKSKTIFTAEVFITDALKKDYNIPGERIRTVYHGLNNVLPQAHRTEQEHVKKRFTAECDYFLYPVSVASAKYLMILLKAFSRLKKRQKTSMKLVLLLKNISEKDLIPDFKNYKYNHDVVILQEREITEDLLVQNAFGLIWFGVYKDSDAAFTALQSEVPVIAADHSINNSLFGDAVLFTDLSEDDLGDKIQLLYKDEEMRNKIIGQSKFLLKKYNADAAAEELRTAMMQ